MLPLCDHSFSLESYTDTPLTISPKSLLISLRPSAQMYFYDLLYICARFLSASFRTFPSSATQHHTYSSVPTPNLRGDTHTLRFSFGTLHHPTCSDLSHGQCSLPPADPTTTFQDPHKFSRSFPNVHYAERPRLRARPISLPPTERRYIVKVFR